MNPLVAVPMPADEAPNATPRTTTDSTVDEPDDFGKSQGLLADLRLALFYTYSDFRKRPRNSIIGFASVLTVVLVTGIILLGISKSRVIFLRFAELTTGEMDALLIAEGTSPFVNYTELQPKIMRSARTSGSAPRWLVKGTAGLYNDSAVNPSNLTGLPVTQTNVLAVDSEREKDIGLGRAYNYRKIGYSEVQVLNSVLDFVDVQPNAGQRIMLALDVQGILDQQQVVLSGFGNQKMNETNSSDNAKYAAAFVQSNPTINIPGMGEVETAPLFGAEGSKVGDFTDTVNGFISFNNYLADNVFAQFLKPECKFTVADGFPNAMGKYPATLGNMAILDYHTFVGMMFDQAGYDQVREPFKVLTGNDSDSVLPPSAALKALFPMEHYALFVVAMMKDRFKVYYMDDTDLQREMIQWSNDLFYGIGVDFGGSVQYPISAALGTFDTFTLFLNAVFTIATIVIVALGALLVYTLLVTNSEERGFEVAMLRAQGMTKRQLFILMTCQTAAFVVPALILGMALVLSINAIVEVVLSLYTYAPVETLRISVYALAIPPAVGILIPLLGNADPIYAALKASLRDALNVYRNKASEASVVAMRIFELGLDPLTVMIAWMLIIFGFLTYYLVPMAFILNEMWLFFFVMNIVLVTMLFGLCLVSGMFQCVLERAMLWLLLWGKDRLLKTLIYKNFKAHSERNAKGFMMFTLSVAVIVFGGVLFALLSSSISEQVAASNGADVTVASLDFETPINRTMLDEFLPTQDHYVKAWSYETFPLSAYPQINGVTRLRNAIGSPAATQDFIGLEPNFLDAAYSEFLLVDSKEALPYSTAETGVPDIVASLTYIPAVQSQYSAGPIFAGYPPNATVPAVETKYSMVMPTISSVAATNVIGLTSGSYGTLDYKYDVGTGPTQTTLETVFMSSTRALVKKFPGALSVSSIPYTFSGAPSFVSVNDFAQLLKANEIDYPDSIGEPNYRYSSDKATTEVWYRKVYIRLQEGLSKRDREVFVNLLQSKVNPYYHSTTDTVSTLQTVQVAARLVMIFFYFIAVIAIFLDTLMLWLAFVFNVQLNAWSFAVLRSLGFTAAQLQRAFVYESLSLVLAGFIVGTAVGVAVAMTLVLQLNLFLQMPFSFEFPFGLYFFLFGLSILSAIIAPLMPAREISRRPISSTLKAS